MCVAFGRLFIISNHLKKGGESHLKETIPRVPPTETSTSYPSSVPHRRLVEDSKPPYSPTPEGIPMPRRIFTDEQTASLARAYVYLLELAKSKQKEGDL